VKMKNKLSPCRKTLSGLWIYFFLLILVPSFAVAQEETLTLEQAVQMALTGNERALAADQRVAAAESRLSKARAYFMPNVNVTGNYTRRPFEVQRTIGNQQIIVQSLNALSGFASFSMTIFDARSIPTLVQTSSDRSSEWYASAETKRGLSFEVSNAFLATLGVDQVLEASRHRLDYARQNLEAAKARYSAGLVSSNDVTRAELEYATAEKGVIQVQGQVETTYLELGYLLNSPIPKKLKVPDFLLQAVEEKPLAVDQLIPEAQARRPDVISLRWRAKAQPELVHFRRLHPQRRLQRA